MAYGYDNNNFIVFMHRLFLMHRHYTDVLREKVVKVAKASGAKVYLATISVIGEEVNNTNHAKIITCAHAVFASLPDLLCHCIQLWSDICMGSHPHVRVVQMPMQ